MKNECLRKEYDFDAIALGTKDAPVGKLFLNKKHGKMNGTKSVVANHFCDDE